MCCSCQMSHVKCQICLNFKCNPNQSPAARHCVSETVTWSEHSQMCQCETGVVFVLIKHVQLTHVSALNVSEWTGCLRSKEEPCSTFIVCDTDVLLSNTSPLHPLTAF